MVSTPVLPTALQELPRHQEGFVRSLRVIDQIENFAIDKEAKLPDLPDLPNEVAHLLLDEVGREEVIRWVNVFRTGINRMRLFNAEQAAGKIFNASDWKLMDESAAKALEVLKIELRDLATPS